MSAQRPSGAGWMLFGAAVALTVSMARIRPWLQRWGATDDDVARTLPGDVLIPAPRYQTTRAIAIQATPATVWSWLVQLGQGRGGFYTFDRLETLMGMTILSANRIVPEFQHLSVGDVVPLSAYGGPAVVEIEPHKTMVLHLVMDPFTGRPLAPATPAGLRRLDWTWAFTLLPVDGANTRLVVRTRADYAPRLLLAPLVAVLLEPAHLLMEWGMLRGIKRRAESMPLTLGALDASWRTDRRPAA